MAGDSAAAGQRGFGARSFERRSGDRLRVPALTLLWHPDVVRVGDRVRLGSLLRGEPVALTATGPAFAPPGEGRAAPLAHPSLGGLRLPISPGPEPCGVTLGGAGTTGEVGVDLAPLHGRCELGPERVARGVVVELAGSVLLLLHEMAAADRWQPPAFGMIGDSEGIVEMRREVARVADLEVPVLLRGETGTGKELMARAIHRGSRRRDRPYVTVNAAAIPPSLAAAELFGAAKGAFTGAVQAQAGYFARAHGGTLFLDEVGEAPPEVQVMLMRVLDRGEVQPLGVQETQRVDVRLIAASDLDFERAGTDGDFRSPLFHRLAAYQIVVPPLRRRRDDFGRLLVAFLRRELALLHEEARLDEGRVGEWLPISIVARLACHPWPGNVRQLENAARQIAIGSRGLRPSVGPQLDRLLQEAVAAAHAPASAPPPGAGAAASRRSGADDEPPPRRAYRDPAEVGEDELVAALRRNHWAIKPTAEELHVARSSLYALIDRIPGLHKGADLERAEILRARDACGGDLHEMSQRLEVSLAGLQQRMRQLEIEG